MQRFLGDQRKTKTPEIGWPPRGGLDSIVPRACVVPMTSSCQSTNEESPDPKRYDAREVEDLLLLLGQRNLEVRKYRG